MNHTALIFGATGAVGKQLLKNVLINGKYSKVVSAGRHSVELEEAAPQEKLIQKTIDFENLEANREDFRNIDDVFCCLGTSFLPKAGAGNAEKFINIDQTYVLNSAKIIKEENKPKGESALSPVHFLYCSSAGSNKSSPFLYLKTKGQTEEALAETGFEKVSIFNPAYLVTVEERKHPHLMERVAFTILNPINNVLGLGLAISVVTVGSAMRKVAEDASIKPKDSSKVQKSVIGSLVSHFPNADIENIGSSKI